MRGYLFAIVLATLSVDVTFGQIGPNPQNPAGTPPQYGQGEEGGRRRMGPPPNVMFTAIDADGDGMITKSELRKAVAALKKLDTDNDGNISLAEVSPWGDPGQMIDRMIAESDKNGDGKLTADEIPDRMQRMLQNADQNADGAIDKAELTAAMEAMRNQFRGGPGRGGFRSGNALNGGANGPDSDPIGRLMQLDTDHNGLSPNEIPPQMQAMFRPDDDQNKDGVLDASELKAVVARMGGAARAIGAGGDPNTFRDPNRRNRGRANEQN